MLFYLINHSNTEKKNHVQVKMKNFIIYSSVLVILTVIISSVKVEGQYFCRSTGVFRGYSPPAGQCSSNCCVQTTVYFTFGCSPMVTNQTAGVLTLKAFQNYRGRVRSKCDSKYYPDMVPVVALSTGWYNGGTRCGKAILISANGKSVKAWVIDECDSTKGCDASEGYHPPCGYNIVAGSKVVWRALGVPQTQSGNLSITWADV
ncbi:kiwellin-1-like [Silene latifolia]|uniref:kiwellin-1-like n=1 Tax=Silene latifolia TaxID=37657 RepID=UPI003D77D07A